MGALTRAALAAFCALALAVSAADRAKKAPKAKPKAKAAATFDVVEASVADLQAAMTSGRITSKQLATGWNQLPIQISA